MNKIIVGIVCGCFILSGVLIFFYSQSEDITTEDTIETKKLIADEISPNIKKIPDKIIEVDYDNIKEDCQITKCTVNGGCVCR